MSPVQLTMLNAAIQTVADGNARPIVHSDRGAHYRWLIGTQS